MEKSKSCLGCGQTLQQIQQDALGYTPKADAELCVRCFRWRQYKDVKLLVDQSPDIELDYELLAAKNGHLVLVVDAFFLAESMISNLSKKLHHQAITVVATKTDIFPKAIAEQKLKQHILMVCKQNHISVKQVLFGNQKSYDRYQQVKDWIQTLDKSKPIIFFGVVNSGKSTLINTLFDTNHLTTAHIPNTTTTLISYHLKDVLIIDTPGIYPKDHIFPFMELSKWQNIQLDGLIHPKTYPSQHSASFTCKDFFILKVVSQHPYSVTLYGAKSLSFTVSKQLDKPIPHDWHQRKIATNKENTWITLPYLGRCKITGIVDKISIATLPYIHPQPSTQEISW